MKRIEVFLGLTVATLISTRILTQAGDRDDAATAFAAACRERAEKAQTAEQAVVRGEDGWLFLTAELRHLGVGSFWGEAAQTASSAAREDARDPLPVIIDTAEQLRRAGIDLLVVPVPPRAAIYADKLPGFKQTPATRLDTALQAFITRLRQEQVEVLDLTDDFLAARAHDAKEGTVCCRTDSHWSPRGSALAAKEIAAWLRTKGIDQAATIQTVIVTNELEIAGDLWRILADTTWPKETVELHGVTTPDGFPLAESPASPVLLMADSHGLVFHAGEDMLTQGAGLFDHLSAALGFPVALLARRGSAATSVRIDLARRTRTDPAFLRNKRAVVWCFAARELTESSGWRTVPLLPNEAE